jgi:glycine cleavage system H protein
MIIPDDLRYSSDHEWVRVEGDLIRVGITDFAQDNLGDVVFLQLPDVGSTLGAGDSFGEVESTKSVSDIYAPVTGEIVQCNDALEADPALVNRDPYGDGWICVIRPTDTTQITALLDAEAYRALTSD